MKKRLRKLALLFALSFVFTSCGSEVGGEYAEKQLSTEAWGQNEEGAYVYGGAGGQLTEQDIQNMNGGNAVIVWDENHEYVTSIVGKFYEGKVTNEEDAIDSMVGIATLLGFTKGQEFFGLFGEQDELGYTYYTYEQRYGNQTMMYSTLRICIDPNGYVCALQNSFIPELGVASKKTMSAQEAEQIVLNTFSGVNLTVYSEYTRQTFYYFNQVYDCMVVYTNNPNVSPSFDMPYLAHYIVIDDGSYLVNIPTSTFENKIVNIDDGPASYFEGLQPATWEGTLTRWDGTQEQVSIPISFNPNDNRYYLMNPERKIAVAMYADYLFNNFTLNFVSSENNQDWDQHDLFGYYNYMRVYDFYAGMGIKSVDGFGMPILLLANWSDQQGNSVDNACYCGRFTGWAVFGMSRINNYSQAIDVLAHEYTHGIRDASMGSALYQNEQGAIHEGYSDVMGNLIEMSMGATADPTWLLAENSGNTLRSMSNPNAYNQPAYVGDVYYYPLTKADDGDVNDHGGVHNNDSLMNLIAYKLSLYGLTTDQQIGVWFHTLELMTPRGDYDDLYAALVFALRIKGYGEYEDALNTIFEEIRLNGDRTETAKNVTKDGYGRVEVNVAPELADKAINLYFYTENGMQISCPPSMADDKVSALIPQGNFMVYMLYREDVYSAPMAYGLDANGNFFADQNNAAVYSVSAGQTVNIGTISK